MAKYMTQQRRRLFAFLREHPDRRFSARDIAAALNDESISLSAVYRNLSALEKDGLIAGATQTGRREKIYRYLNAEACRECIHMTCLKCGQTFHLDIPASEKLLADAMDSEGFCISKTRTVLYGMCRSCGEEEKNNQPEEK